MAPVEYAQGTIKSGAKRFIQVNRSRPPDLVSNTCMEPNDRNEQRLNDLEIKASYLEDTLDQLDRIIIRQQEQIDLLIRELTHLRQQAPEPGTARNLRDELPPHY